MNIKFARFLCLQKHTIFRQVNNPSEENFSHNNWPYQFITHGYYCDSTALAKKHGVIKTRAGEASNTRWRYFGRK